MGYGVGCVWVGPGLVFLFAKGKDICKMKRDELCKH
jgi:hypothetical protein